MVAVRQRWIFSVVSGGAVRSNLNAVRQWCGSGAVAGFSNGGGAAAADFPLPWTSLVVSKYVRQTRVIKRKHPKLRRLFSLKIQRVIDVEIVIGYGHLLLQDTLTETYSQNVRCFFYCSSFNKLREEVVYRRH